jgi:hypothetical protein
MNRLAPVLLVAWSSLFADSGTRIPFHVKKVTSTSGEDNSGPGSRSWTEYTVEGYDVDSETTYRGTCRDTFFYNQDGKLGMHVICIVPHAGGTYDVKLFPASFMFSCDTPDGKCPGTDPSVDHYTYAAYSITYEEEKPKHK